MNDTVLKIIVDSFYYLGISIGVVTLTLGILILCVYLTITISNLAFFMFMIEDFRLGVSATFISCVVFSIIVALVLNFIK